MNKKARNATIFGIAAGLVMVPIVRAVIRRYKSRKPAAASVEGPPPNRLFSAYRRKFKPHRRTAKDNGVH